MHPIQRDIPIVSADLDGDGRTVVIRALPLDKPTKVSDDGRTWYREVWRAGAFADLRPQRTVLQRNHDDAHGANVVGICRSIAENDGHVVTEFELLDEAPLAGLARRLLREGTWSGASVSVIMHRNGSRKAGELVERTRVSDFRHLALVDRPAYEDAKVLAVRHEPVDVSGMLAKYERLRTLAVKRPG